MYIMSVTKLEVFHSQLTVKEPRLEAASHSRGFDKLLSAVHINLYKNGLNSTSTQASPGETVK